jgi:hypothetical protein
MGIQVTPIPRLTVLTDPAFTLGTANAAGSADTAVASNSTLLAFDATDPAAVAASAVVGTAVVASRRDHAHAGVVANNPGVAKVWNTWNGTGSQSILESYNIASIADGGGTGETDHSFTTDFAAGETDYAVVGAGQQNYAIYTGGAGASKSVSVVSTITLLTTTGAAADRTENYMAIFGEQ